MRNIIAVATMLFLAPGAEARSFLKSVTRPLEKATEWVGKQSGITPTMDNANDAARQAQEAAKAAETALVEMKPKANAALDSLTRTSTSAGDILVWVKWPLVASAYCLAVWLASLAMRGWRESPVKIGALPILRDLKPSYDPSPHGGSARLAYFGRFRWGFLGCALFFWAGYALFLDGSSEISRDRDYLLAFVVLAAASCAAVGIALAFLPFRRPFTCALFGLLTPAFTLAYFASTTT